MFKYSVKEVAKKLKLHSRIISQMIDAGQLPAIYTNHGYRVTEDGLKSFLEENSIRLAWLRSKYTCCLNCGTLKEKHVARGLCVKCYRYENENQQKSHLNRGGFKRRRPEEIIPKSELEYQYLTLKMSLGDLSRKYGCTRQNIYYLLVRHGISTRNKAAARKLALSNKKIVFNLEDQLGNKRKVIVGDITINKDFFKSWSPEMAYVLGVIYTDGNLSPSCLRDPKAKASSKTSRFSVSQKEPELLEKILVLMVSNAKLYFQKKRGIAGPLFYFHINNDAIYDDLLRLGLKPNKSLSLTFPEIPQAYTRHFIRGCWDGDGSVGFYKNNPAKGFASFVSGSKSFIEGIISELVNLGLPERRLYRQRRSFYFRYTGSSCAKLYHILYDDVPESMYLKRKYERFKVIAEYHEPFGRSKSQNGRQLNEGRWARPILVSDFYNGKMIAILEKYGLRSDSLTFVNNLQDWWNEHYPSYPDNNPFRVAICHKDERKIYFEKEISDDMINSVKRDISIKGRGNRVLSLNTDWLFLLHTLLHEICHILNKEYSCKDCDDWAFKEMSIE